MRQAVSLAVAAADVEDKKAAFGSRGEKTTARLIDSDKRDTAALSPLRLLFPMMMLIWQKDKEAEEERNMLLQLNARTGATVGVANSVEPTFSRLGVLPISNSVG